jgi:hypothetical protein
LRIRRGEEVVTETEGDLSSGQVDLVRVRTVENRFEADLLMQALRQENIPVMLRRFEETAYDGLFVTQMGWGAIMVPGDYEQAASGIIDRVLESISDKHSPVAPDVEEEAG